MVQRERQRERDRQTDRQTDRDRETETERDRERREREREKVELKNTRRNLPSLLSNVHSWVKRKWPHDNDLLMLALYAKHVHENVDKLINNVLDVQLCSWEF